MPGAGVVRGSAAAGARLRNAPGEREKRDGDCGLSLAVHMVSFVVVAAVSRCYRISRTCAILPAPDCEAWRHVSSPDLGGACQNNALNGVATSSSTSIWAVGLLLQRHRGPHAGPEAHQHRLHQAFDRVVGWA